MDNNDLKKTVNKILTKKGLPAVKKFGEEFADGILFVKLFNAVYDEKIDCKLSPTLIPAERMINWSRVNQVICFNYFQQRFYLVESTMETLSNGKKPAAILKLIKIMLTAQ